MTSAIRFDRDKAATFWETDKIRQRSLANQIRVGDAAIFFEDVRER